MMCLQVVEKLASVSENVGSLISVCSQAQRPSGCELGETSKRGQAVRLLLCLPGVIEGMLVAGSSR